MVGGILQVDNVAIRCGLAVKVPFDHIQPKIVVLVGAMTVFDADNERFEF